MSGPGLRLTSGQGSGVAAAAVRSKAGLVAHWDPASLVLSDGAAVASWTDSVGGLAATQSSSAHQPTYSATGGPTGGPCVTFSQASLQYLDVSAALAALLGDFEYGAAANQYTVAALVKRSSNTVNSIVFGASGGTSNLTYRYGSLDNGGGSGWSDGSANIYTNPGPLPSSTATHLPTYSTEWALVFFVHGAAQSMVWCNGQSVTGTTGTTDNATTPSAVYIGGMLYNGSLHPAGMDGSIAGLWVWRRPLSQADIAAFVLANGFQAFVRYQVFALGDSITSGSVSAPAWLSMLATPPTYAVSLTASNGTIAAQSTYVNQALASRCATPNPLAGTSNTELVTYGTDLTHFYAQLPCVIVVALDTNDIYYSGATSSTAATVAAAIVARTLRLCGQIRALCPHAYIVLATALPRGNWSTNASSATIGTSVSSVSNSGGLFELTFSTAHELYDGAAVVVSGATGATGLDGTWNAHVIGDKAIVLVGSTYAAGYTSGAVVTFGAYTSDAGYNTCLAAVAAGIRAGWQGVADAVWDWNGIAALSTPGSVASPGPGYVDACHPIGGARPGQGSIADSAQMSTWTGGAITKLLLSQASG